MKGLFGFGKKKEENTQEERPQSQQGKWLIQYDRTKCIGSGTCAAVCEKHWKMEDDGKAHLIGSVFNERAGMFEKSVEDTEFDGNKAAAEGCPPNCIHVINKETGEKIV